jgi:hypothetical protein
MAKFEFDDFIRKGSILMDEGNYEAGAMSYQISANDGNPYGQFLLSFCYRDGQGVPKDMKKAIFWLKKAAAQGLDEALEYLRKVSSSTGIPFDELTSTPSAPAPSARSAPAPTPASSINLIGTKWEMSCIYWAIYSTIHECTFMANGSLVTNKGGGTWSQNGSSVKLKSGVCTYELQIVNSKTMKGTEKHDNGKTNEVVFEKK